MIMNRVFARASKKTFSIPPIKSLLERYLYTGFALKWADPYAGWLSPAQFTNDINPERQAKFHLDALEFTTKLSGITRYLSGVLFDPPYSYRQVSEHYKMAGRKATALDTSYNFYARVMDPLGKMVRKGGIVISFGWNSNGFGKKRGFEIIEILIVAHGLHHNDTIVTVERKI